MLTHQTLSYKQSEKMQFHLDPHKNKCSMTIVGMNPDLIDLLSIYIYIYIYKCTQICTETHTYIHAIHSFQI